MKLSSKKRKEGKEGDILENKKFRITRNIIKCKKCGDMIESFSVHDFKFCKCGAVAVDGGRDYLKRSGNRENWEELSEIQDVCYKFNKKQEIHY